MGVFRAVERPVYADSVMDELERTRERVGEEDLDGLLTSGYTWTVEPD